MPEAALTMKFCFLVVWTTLPLLQIFLRGTMNGTIVCLFTLLKVLCLHKNHPAPQIVFEMVVPSWVKVVDVFVRIYLDQS